MPEQLSARSICSRCGQTRSKKKCSNCRSITYCGEECQRQDWERHKDNCIPVMLTESRGKGRGLVASRDIQIGQLILTEEAAVTYNIEKGSVFGRLRDVSTYINNTIQNASKSVRNQVKRMSRERQSQFYNLGGYGSRSTSEDPWIELEIFMVNRTPDDETETEHLFLNLSLINHSCAPNTAWSYKASSESAANSSSDSYNVFIEEYSELAKYLFMGSAVFVMFSDWSIFWQILSYIMILFLNVPATYLCSGVAVYIMLEDWCFIWKILSFFLINHTYSEVKDRWERKSLPSRPNKELELRAIKNIRKGEEITLCYLGYDQNLGSKHQMKQNLLKEFEFNCKCSICIGDIPHQNLTKEKIRSLQKRIFRQNKRVYRLKKRLSDWRRDAIEQNKIIDLTKTLHVGPLRLSREYSTLIRMAQMSRDSEILDKALKDFKEVVMIYKLEDWTKEYEDLVSGVKLWSSQFKSRCQPGRREFSYFFPCCGSEL